MKDFIVLIAVLLLLLPFPLQYALEEYNHHLKSEVHSYVNTAKEKAKQIGYFSDEIIEELKDVLNNRLNIKRDDIIIDVTTTPKYRTNEFDERELIYYKVEVPIDRIIAVPYIWGIDQSDNKGTYILEGFISSEAISP